MAAQFTASAPGKALIAGGYLVLESPNIGVTIASSSRFYATARSLDRGDASAHTAALFDARSADTTAAAPLNIIVESPQFHSTFCFAYHSSNDKLAVVSSKSNEFIEKCLELVLSFCKLSLGEERLGEIVAAIAAERGFLGIKLRADNDFYSQVKVLQERGMPLLSASLAELPKFTACPIEDGKVQVAKTGMGSSAALTTSLVAALLSWFRVINLDSSDCAEKKEARRIIHNTAQLAHAIAQGKLGSGFDVSAAVHGTQMYRRFSADNFKACMEPGAPPSTIYESVTSEALWTHTVAPFTLPPSMDIMMGDVCGGSSSTSMAREVLRWRAEQPQEAGVIWSELAATNMLIFESFERLSALAKTNRSEYFAAIDTLCAGGDLEAAAPVGAEFSTQRRLFKRSRELLRAMGEGAGVGIEPQEQTQLADATERVPGVLCAGVPGAGGVDAVFAIILSAATRDGVEAMWAEWRQRGGATVVCPLLLTSDSPSPITSSAQSVVGPADCAAAGVRLENGVSWQ